MEVRRGSRCNDDVARMKYTLFVVSTSYRNYLLKNGKKAASFQLALIYKGLCNLQRRDK